MSAIVAETKSPSPAASVTLRAALLRNPAVWILIAAFTPGLIAYFSQLWNLEHYQFFPFALAGAAALANRERKEEPFTPGVPSAALWCFVMLIGLGLLAGSVLFGSPWAAYSGALVTLLGVLYGAGGGANVARFFPAIVMLLVILRPPMGFDLLAIKKLQALTARAAGEALDVLNVTHVRAGNVIEIPGRRLFVEEACSGVNSLFSALACTVFYLLWTRRHAFVWFVMLLSLPFWVLTANAGRITLVALLRHKWGITADVGWRHDFLGYVVFGVAILLLFATERLLSFYAAVLPPKNTPPENAPPLNPKPQPTATMVPALSRGWWLLPAVVSGVLIALQMPALAREVRDRSLAAAQVRFEVLGEKFLPDSFAGWERKKYEQIDRNRASAFGEHSQVWQYLGQMQRVTASLDYPFIGWHELVECYESQGWHTEDRSTTEADGLSYVVVKMIHPLTGRHGRLWFALLKHDGRSFAARKFGEVEELRDRLATRLREQMSWTAPKRDDDDWTYQIQVFVEGYGPPSEAAVADAQKLFVDFAQRLQARWSATAP